MDFSCDFLAEGRRPRPFNLISFLTFFPSGGDALLPLSTPAQQKASVFICRLQVCVAFISPDAIQCLLLVFFLPGFLFPPLRALRALVTLSHQIDG